MAANIIDALVVTLGLDNRDFRRGQRETQDDLQRLREGGKRATDDIASGGQRATEAFRAVRNEVAGLLVVLAGAKGVKQLLGDIVSGDANTGRLATNLGVSTRELSAWQIAVKGAGGNADDASAAFQTLVSTFENVRLRGDLSQGAELTGLGVTDLSDPSKALMQIAEARSRMSAPEFQNRLQHLGLSPGIINLLTQGTAAVRDQVKAARDHAAITEEDARKAEQLQQNLAALEGRIKNGLRPELYMLVDGFNNALTNMREMNALSPAVEVAVGAVGLAALAAAGPWLVLSSAIGAALLAYRDWQAFKNMTPDQRNAFEARGAKDRSAAWQALSSGDFAGFFSSVYDGVYGRYQAPGSGAAGANLFGQQGGIFERLLMQESGGRAGVTGPMTRYGQAHGMSQMLDGTAREMAAKLGVAWRPDLMRGTTPEAAAYQRRLGEAYYQEGLERFHGNVRKALMFYHGGPNQRLWGPHTNAYAESILRNTRGLHRPPAGATTNTTNINGPITIHTAATDASGIAHSLQSELRKRGLIYQAQPGMTQ